MKSFDLLKGLALSSLVLMLAACGNGAEDEESAETEVESEETEETEQTPDDANIFNYEDFPQVVSNDAEPTGAGTLNVGYSSDTPFDGTFNWAFYTLGPEADVLSYIDEAVFTFDADQQATNEGPIHFELNEEDSSVTFTVQDGITWHDGEPLKITDYIASYEIIGHPEYEGVRGSTEGFTSLVGYDEYRAGEADEISGIEVIDDKTAVFTYKRLAPSLTAGGFWAYAFPKHHYEGLDITEMASAPETRDNPIGIGPYKIDTVTTGESLALVKYEDYWRGEPQLDGINIRIIPGSSITNSLETGEIHIAMNYPTTQYPDVAGNENLDNVEWLAQIQPIYDYIGFKYGTWDGENNKVDYKPEESKVGDVELRRAMWHALDNDAVGERFYNGLRWKATTLIPPYHKNFHNDEIEVPDYNVEEANRILDEAGYEDVDGDGFREDPDGEKFELNFASMSGGETSEALATYYLQQWQEIGIDIEKLDGRLIEYNTFYDMLENDEPGIDVFLAGWQVGTDVDPSGLYGPNAPYNYIRYESDLNTELLERGVSDEALDTENRIDIYREWQELMVEDVVVIPTVYRSNVQPVSKDVVNFSVEIGFNEENALYNLGLTE